MMTACGQKKNPGVIKEINAGFWTYRAALIRAVACAIEKALVFCAPPTSAASTGSGVVEIDGKSVAANYRLTTREAVKTRSEIASCGISIFGFWRGVKKISIYH